VAPQVAEYHPLPTTLVPDRQLPRRNAQVVPGLEDYRPADRDNKDEQREGGREWASPREVRRRARLLSSRIDLREPERPGDGNDRVTQRNRDDDRHARDRQQVIVLPVEAGQGHLEPGGQRPAGGQSAPRFATGTDGQIGQGRRRGQPERPAPGPPPD